MSDSVVIGDWGNTRLRLWRLEKGEVADRRDGAGMLASGDPSETLASSLGDWIGDNIILGGMAGARGGLRETPYLPCPVTSEQWQGQQEVDGFRGSRLRIALGLSCRNASGRPDVIRGEEAQIFGALALHPELAVGTHLVLLPGTHSKWAWLEDRAILHFRTFLTGELFALLTGSSLIAGHGTGTDENGGFTIGLARAKETDALSCALFEARAAQLLDGKTGYWARGFISGLLIGAEVSQMGSHGMVVVIGDPGLAARYCDALTRRGVPTRQLDGDACALAGLRLLDDN